MDLATRQRRSEQWRRRTDVPLLVLAIGSLPLVLLELDRRNLPAQDRWFIDAVNMVVLVAFGIDYLVRLWLAPSKPAYVRKEWIDLIIVVTQVVALVPAMAPVRVLRVLRAARVWRAVAVVARVAAIGGRAARSDRS